MRAPYYRHAVLARYAKLFGSASERAGAQAIDLLGVLRRRTGDAIIHPAPITRALLVDGLKAAAAPFLVSRLLVWAATLFGARYIPAPAGISSNLNPPAALAPFFHWDAAAYSYIANHGYVVGPGSGTPQQVIVAWLPGYPLLVHLTGGSDWAMFIIANVCFFAALAVLHVVAVIRMDSDRARLTLWLVALGPAAMFFSYPYPESLFLLLCVVAFALMESGHWLLAGVAGLGAAITRVPGVLIAAALGAEAALGNRRRVVFAAILLPLAGMASVSLIDWIQMGDPLGFYHAHEYWVGPARNPLYLVGSFPKAIIEGDPFRPESIGVPVLIIFAIGAAWVALRMPAAYGAFAVTQVLLALRQGLFLHFFISVPRYVAVIFPCYFAFATLLARRRNLQLTWLLVSAASMVVNAALFGAWRFLG
jgi:hypothetical protein